MNAINILFLGGAKRVSMARLFKKAAATRQLDCHIFSYELQPCVPVASEAQIITGTLWSDPEILSKLSRAVTQHDIDIVVPFVDPSIAIAARLRDTLNGVKRIYVPTGSALTADIMLDKIRSAKAFEEAGIPAPRTFTQTYDFPFIAKPRYGSASKGIMVIENLAEMERLSPDPDKYLIQEYISERTEYTVDCFVDADGNIKACQPRIRLATAGGEVTDTVTVDDSDLLETSYAALSKLGLKGASTLQFIRDRRDGRLLIMEVNPRLGGGVVASVYAGADLPGMIIDEAMSVSAYETSRPVAGVRMTRYMQEVVFMPDSTKPTLQCPTK